MAGEGEGINFISKYLLAQASLGPTHAYALATPSHPVPFWHLQNAKNNYPVTSCYRCYKLEFSKSRKKYCQKKNYL